MKNFGHNPPPQVPPAGQWAPADARVSQQTRRSGTNLSVEPEAVFTDSVVRGLIDDWLVPLLVEKFIDDGLVKQSQDKR